MRDSKVREGERGLGGGGERKGGSTILADCEATKAVNMVGRDAQLMRERPHQLIHRHRKHTNTPISPLHTQKPLIHTNCGEVVDPNWM